MSHYEAVNKFLWEGAHPPTQHYTVLYESCMSAVNVVNVLTHMRILPIRVWDGPHEYTCTVCPYAYRTAPYAVWSGHMQYGVEYRENANFMLIWVPNNI